MGISERAQVRSFSTRVCITTHNCSRERSTFRTVSSPRLAPAANGGFFLKNGLRRRGAGLASPIGRRQFSPQFGTHRRASEGRGGAVSCRACVFQQNSAVCVRPGVVSQGCSENPSRRGLRNPITAAIGQSKNQLLSQVGPWGVLSLVFQAAKNLNSRVANWLGVCHPCTSLSSKHTTR
jgi:hypothetical protein